jgi:hypothetical protein
MQRKNESSQKIGIPEVEDLLSRLFDLPRTWVLAVGLAALMSVFEVTRQPEGGISVTVRVATITAILVALVWLPALVRVVALVGGGIKTPAGEVRTEGLLDILRQSDAAMKREVLPGVIGALSIAKKTAPQARHYSELLERELDLSIAPDTEQARKDLAAMLEEYKRLRELPFGHERTAKVSTVAARIRALAVRSGYTSAEFRQLLEADRESGVIVLLGLLQSNPDARYFDTVLREVENPIGPQEQYYALVAIETMLPSLSSEQSQKVEAAIRTQEYIKPENEGRWAVSRAILAKVRHRE